MTPYKIDYELLAKFGQWLSYNQSDEYHARTYGSHIEEWNIIL